MLLSVFAVILIGLTLYTLRIEEKKKDTASNIPEKERAILDTARVKALNIMEKAQQDAKDLLVEAELASVKFAANRKIDVSHIEKKYEQDLEKLASQTLSDLTQATEKIKHEYERFATESEQIISHHLETNQSTLDQHMEKLVEKNQQDIDSFFKAQHARIESEISSELEASKKLLKSYEKTRLKMVDDHIADLVTQTTLLVLKKGLSIQDHSELIKEALAQAKNDGLFKDISEKSP